MLCASLPACLAITACVASSKLSELHCASSVVGTESSPQHSNASNVPEIASECESKALIVLVNWLKTRATETRAPERTRPLNGRNRVDDRARVARADPPHRSVERPPGHEHEVWNTTGGSGCALRGRVVVIMFFALFFKLFFFFLCPAEGQPSPW